MASTNKTNSTSDRLGLQRLIGKTRGLVLLFCLVPVIGLAAPAEKPVKRIIAVKTVPLTGKPQSKQQPRLKPMTQLGYSLKSPKVMQTRASLSPEGALLKRCDDINLSVDVLPDELRKEVK